MKWRATSARPYCHGGARADRQPVHRVLEHEWHAHVGKLGRHQERQRGHRWAGPRPHTHHLNFGLFEVPSGDNCRGFQGHNHSYHSCDGWQLRCEGDAVSGRGTPPQLPQLPQLRRPNSAGRCTPRAGPTTRALDSGLSLGQMYGRMLLMIFRLGLAHVYEPRRGLSSNSINEGSNLKVRWRMR